MPTAKGGGMDANALTETSMAPIATAQARCKAMGMGSGPVTSKVKLVPFRERDGKLAASC
jgi:hypothetical protein